MCVQRSLIRIYVLVALISFFSCLGWPQQISNFERDRANDMLKVIGDEVRKHYYDPKLHGLNWDATLETARQNISRAPSFNMCLSHIAAALDALNDSHTFFLPPQHVTRVDYGFQYQMMENGAL